MASKDGIVTISKPMSAAPAEVSPQDAEALKTPTLKRSPEEWARAKGLYHRANPLIPQVAAHYDYRHAAADVLHGWAQHAYHYANAPFTLSLEDYEAALDAAVNYPVKPAHAAAVAKGSD